MNKFLFMVCAFTFLTCSSSKEVVQVKKEDFESNLNKVAIEKFEDHFTIISNESNSYSLVLKKYKNLEDLIANVHFFVFNNQTQEIIHTNELKSGTVKWISNTEILAIARNLKIGDKKVIKYVFNVVTDKKSVLE